MITNSQTFRSVAETIVPETRQLDELGWSGVGTIIEYALARRPAKVRRQVGLFLRLLNVISLVRFRRPLHQLIPSTRLQLLEELQTARIPLLRRGLWGVRTLIFMGYYARPDARIEIGYRATVHGWEARR